MLFKVRHLLGIRAGKITLAFRKWGKPSVKAGSTMRSAMGVIRVVDVEQVGIKSITVADAVNAGYDNLEELLKALSKVGMGKVYKVRLKYESADPRINMSSQSSLSEVEYQKLVKKLERLDKAAINGSWTMVYLKLIEKNPERRAGDLADILGLDKMAFKMNVRKLKNLGLTISHEVGYRVSPLGEWVIKKIP